MTPAETKFLQMTRSEKDDMLLKLLLKNEAAIKKAYANRLADESKRKRHNQLSSAGHMKKYREDPEYRQKVLSRNRQRYWAKKREQLDDGHDHIEESDLIQVEYSGDEKC